MPIKQAGRNGKLLGKVQSFKTEPGRQRKYEQTNYKYHNSNYDLKTPNK